MNYIFEVGSFPIASYWERQHCHKRHEKAIMSYSLPDVPNCCIPHLTTNKSRRCYCEPLAAIEEIGLSGHHIYMTDNMNERIEKVWKRFVVIFGHQFFTVARTCTTVHDHAAASRYRATASRYHVTAARHQVPALQHRVPELQYQATTMTSVHLSIYVLYMYSSR